MRSGPTGDPRTVPCTSRIPSGAGLSAAEPAWVTGSVDLLLRFSDEIWNGQRLSLKLAACGRMGSVLVAGICFFLHVCFNLIFESGIGEEYFVGCIGPKPVVGTESERKRPSP